MNDQQFVNLIGGMVEENENNLRNIIEEIYLRKTKEVKYFLKPSTLLDN